MAIPPNALYIGHHPGVYKSLQKLKPEWNFLPQIETVEDASDRLLTGEITNDIQIIFVLDNLFDETGNDKSFENFVLQTAPYCFFAIISYKPRLQDLIIERVSDAAYIVGVDQKIPFYFIDKAHPKESINRSLSTFLREANTPDLIDTKNRILGIEVSQEPIVEKREPVKNFDYDYNSEDDDTESEYMGNIIAVTSSKGGSGKSTVAIMLSTLLAHSSENSVKKGLEDRPLKVIIVDFDVRDGQLGFLTGHSKPTFLKLGIEGISDETLDETIIKSNNLKVDLLIAPRKPRSSENLPTDFYHELLQKLKKRYDYVILDTSVNYLDPLLEEVAYPTADKIIFVTDVVVNSVFSMTRWVQEVIGPKEKNGMEIDKRKIGIVVNKSLADINMSGKKISDSALNLPLITAIPSNPKLIAHAANMQTMEKILKHGDLYKSFLRLAKAVVGKSYNLSEDLIA